MNQEEKRAQWRESYARRFPPGFPRRRNAEQTRKQLAAQQVYESRQPVMRIRRLQKVVRRLLKGPFKAGEQLVGCTHEQLVAHFNFPGQFCVAYLRHPREFNLDNMTERHAAFHYTNLYARPKSITANSTHAKSFQCPLQQAQSLAVSSHAARTAQV